MTQQQRSDYNTIAADIINDRNVVGQILKPYGGAGELVVRWYDGFSITAGGLLWAEIDGLAVPIFAQSVVSQGVSKSVILFDDFATADYAAQLIGLKLYTQSIVGDDNADDSTNNQDDGEWGFLVGYSFEDVTSGARGVVVGSIDNVMNPLLVVEVEGIEHYVPIDESLIKKVHRSSQRLVMRLAVGLLDLGNVVAVEDER